MNELQNTATATVAIDRLKNTDLIAACNEIVEIGRKTTENIYRQFNIMADIFHKDLFLQDFPLQEKEGKKDAFGRFSKTIFGIDVSTAYKMVRVSDEYLKGENVSILCDSEGNDFSPSALMELLSRKEQGNNKGFTPDDVAALVERGHITSDDTIKDIREKVKKELRGIREEPKKKPKILKAKPDINVLIAELKNYGKKKKDEYLIGLANKMVEAVQK